MSPDGLPVWKSVLGIMKKDLYDDFVRKSVYRGCKIVECRRFVHSALSNTGLNEQYLRMICYGRGTSMSHTLLKFKDFCLLSAMTEVYADMLRRLFRKRPGRGAKVVAGGVV